MVATLPITQNSHNGRSGPGQTTPACSLPTGHGAGDNGLGVMARATKRLAQGGRTQPIGRTQIISNVLGARGGAMWQENVLPLHWL